MKLFLILILWLASTQLIKSQLEEECNCTETLSVGTWNSFQIVIAPFKEERLEASIEYFKTAPLDIVCIQELWDPEERDQFIQELIDVFPYSYFAPQQNETECSQQCSEEETDPLIECLNTSCNNVTEMEEQMECAKENCEKELASLSESCQACISLKNASTILEGIEECVVQDDFENENTKNCRFLFDGWSDNLLLSKIPFEETDYLLYENNTVVAWTALYGKLNTSVFDTVHVFCTHLAADILLFDFEEQNEAQTRELIDYVSETIEDDTESPVLVIGDFNSGPEVGDSESRFRSYDVILEETEWINLYLVAGNVECTRCRDNPLVVFGRDEIIDLIWADNFENVCIVNSSRFAVEEGIEILGAEIPLSDHYGVRAEICQGENNFRVPEAEEVNAAISLGSISILLLFNFALWFLF